jgi:hypothetical protein
MQVIRAAIAAVLSVLATPMFVPQALAHCYVGGRFFPAMLATDDPCVADELSLPTISVFNTADDPPSSQVTVAGEFSKRITPTLGLSIGSTWTQISPPGQPSVSGFQNLETTLKWQFGTIPEREFVMSAGIAIEWGGTGSQAVGADTFNTYTPTVWLGKGFGDLPDSVKWLRPFAVTGQVGYAVPGVTTMVTGIDPDSGNPTTQTNPQMLRWGASLQYSMPYLKANVVDAGIPEFFNRMIFIVETSMQTPVANTQDFGILTTGTINPGLIWIGRFYQVGVEAIVPVNRASGASVGVIAQVHIYLDDLFPGSIGKPLFGGSGMARRMGY